MSVKQLRLDMKVRNNRLIRAREELGMTQAEAARQIGIGASDLSALELLRKAARSDTGWTPTAERIASFYGLSLEWLWPIEIHAIRKTALRLEMNACEMASMAGIELDAAELAGAVESALACLPPIQREAVVRTIVDDQTLQETGKKYDLSREQIRVYRERGLANLRGLLSASEPAVPTALRARLIERMCPVCMRRFKTSRAPQTICSRSCVARVMCRPQARQRRAAEREVALWVWSEGERGAWAEADDDGAEAAKRENGRTA